MIRKHLVSDSIAKRVTYPGTNNKKYIVIHETANTRKGADANAHARLQASGNSRQASWHYQVDDKEIVQSFSDDKQCWHAGNRYYNENSIGIEICVNEDGDFKKAVDNAIELTKYLMNKYNIPASNVIQHNHASGKNCPRYLRSGEKGITWSDFKAKLTSSKTKINKPKTSEKSTAAKKTKANLVVDGYWGKQTTRALQRYFGTPVDGEIWGQYKGNQAAKAITGGVKYGPPYGSPVIEALQKHVGAKADGVLGPQTVRALQRHLGTPVDGEIWKPSTMVKAMQKRLNGGDL